ncbi:MAG: cyclase family protein [Thermoprotei archaeon]
MSFGEDIYRLVLKSKVYDLGQPYWRGMPVHPADPPFGFYLYRYHEHTKDLFQDIAPGFADSISLIVTSMHAGTHLDTPIHMSRNLRVLGVDVTRFESDSGYTGLPEGLLSVDRLTPLVLRGVLLDVPAYKKVDILPERYEITARDLEETLKYEGVELHEGDCALIRTGYSRYFLKDADAYLHHFAGLGAEAAKWLANKKVKLVGIDNLAAGVPKPFEVHNILLSDNGILLMKSLNLEELSADRKYITTVVVSPLKIKGGEASLVRPLAIG